MEISPKNIDERKRPLAVVSLSSRKKGKKRRMDRERETRERYEASHWVLYTETVNG
jgi:hypothetical protein